MQCVNTMFAHRRWAFAAAVALAVALVLASAAAFTLSPPPATAASGIPARALAAEASSDTTPLPLLMADTKGARQLVIATAPRLGDTTGTLQVFDLVDGAWVETITVPARFGRRGLMDGTKRKAGNQTTPTGIWNIPNWTFGTHRLKPAGSKMGYRRMTSNTWWSSKRGGTYNRWVEARRWTGEHIGASPKAYEYALSTGYNARPNTCVFGRGSGIFLHVRGAGLTAGCVAVSRASMIRVCKVLDPAKNPYFAIGTLEPGTPTSISAY